MKFRNVLLVGAVTLIAGLVAATLGAVALVLEREARQQVDQELARGRDVFADLQTYRESLFRSEGRVVADEPRLKAVVDTREVNHETVLGVALDLRKAMRSELFLLTDSAGQLIADVADPAAVGFDLSKNPVVAAALRLGEGKGIWTEAGRVYQVQAQRLSFGTTHVGVVVIGYPVDDRVAETVYRQTGDSVVIELDGLVVARSSLQHGGALKGVKLDGALRAVKTGAPPIEVRLAGRRYLAQAAAFPGYEGTRPLRYAILRSLDRALEPAHRVRRALLWVSCFGVAAAAALAALLARRLARPIDELVTLAGRIGEGDLSARAREQGPRELRALGEAMNRMGEELGVSRAKQAEQERLSRELELAAGIQTSILPRITSLAGLEVAARMVPAEEVGGDYYDLLPVEEGAWIGIGDVAGHGLPAGLVMLMVQSVVASLVHARPDAAPRELVAALNAVLYENVRERLGQDEHVTFTLLRYLPDGQLTYAGAHEELVILRARTGRCERLPTPGTWLAAIPDVGRSLVDSKAQLDPGDLLVLYSDGLIQAMDPAGEQFGMERMCAELEAGRDQPVEALCERVLGAVRAFAPELDDDLTLVIARRPPLEHA